jgi:hypothetical protein
MKLCQCCGQTAEDNQATCPKCGEASWVSAGVVDIANPKDYSFEVKWGGKPLLSADDFKTKQGRRR